MLKNSLLRFAGANVGLDGWDEGNEKKMADRIVNLLERFEKVLWEWQGQKKESHICPINPLSK